MCPRGPFASKQRSPVYSWLSSLSTKPAFRSHDSGQALANFIPSTIFMEFVIKCITDTHIMPLSSLSLLTLLFCLFQMHPVSFFKHILNVYFIAINCTQCRNDHLHCVKMVSSVDYTVHVIEPVCRMFFIFQNPNYTLITHLSIVFLSLIWQPPFCCRSLQTPDSLRGTVYK